MCDSVTRWNIGVRKIPGLPYTTHIWMLGSLTNSVHMKYKLYIRDFKFLTRLSQGFDINEIEDILTFF